MTTATLPGAAAEAPTSDAPWHRLDVPGPHYTSYPTAGRFADAFGAEAYCQVLRRRAQGAVVGCVAPLSLRIHRDGHEIQVTATAWTFVHAIAVVFDRHLHADPQRARFSRVA